MLASLSKRAAITLVAVASTIASAQSTIKIDGSSTVFPITEAVAEEFQKANPGSKVTVGISGTGGGFKKFVRGETDISNASRPILAKEIEEAVKNGIEFIELPVAFDALTVTVNPKNTAIKEFTVAELKKIWEPEAQGKVTKWNQVNPAWPANDLKLYGAGSDSGTFDYFTEAVVGKSKSSRGDYTASEDDNTLVQGVAKDPNAIGYFGYAYYAENTDKLRAVPIVNPATGKGVVPSESTVKDGSYAPLSRPIFIYINKKSLARPEVSRFIEFYMTQGQDLIKEVKYIPLPSDSYVKALDRVKKGQSGTAFGGHSETGMSIDELFARPLSMEFKK
ncbi:MAG: PstS family phosphate ABC transporter substrate-binding protein [Phycisphaerae bacterium]|nr:PstS family phosphate ABC transporter substrate-binding protein [Phycisphaerae bacterium]